MLLLLQLMVCFTHSACKNRNRKKLKPRFSVKNRLKPNWKWKCRTITALENWSTFDEIIMKIKVAYFFQTRGTKEPP